ncbi:hypothetical protein [Bradyrhizobium arachidis]|uniref:hypothetical protein n=1 Tax=Bradyrhizobium arachidis TaxID=858423 RepID=UPI00142D3833|nr:hypothetical protein [Bradyrhizobium arachidis]
MYGRAARSAADAGAARANKQAEANKTFFISIKIPVPVSVVAFRAQKGIGRCGPTDGVLTPPKPQVVSLKSHDTHKTSQLLTDCRATRIQQKGRREAGL